MFLHQFIFGGDGVMVFMKRKEVSNHWILNEFKEFGLRKGNLPSQNRYVSVNYLHLVKQTSLKIIFNYEMKSVCWGI